MAHLPTTPEVFMMDFDSRAGPSKRVRYGDPDFEETLLKWADEVDEDDSDIDSDAEFIYKYFKTAVEFCLKTTYFLCENSFSQTAMGSPISSTIANLVMEKLEILFLKV
ncbi:unnamed protein product [Acanthoscelides obtectus]|uniref:Uncharacterized protein n=1 Tax=Acanthoscelides obtectus TaxID=200917 RepID=A0A9P0KE96_ACAOB|nr:unnamed protein product [Acanthoscelides obtectus]CAK1646941.1 hypothetical protein AOBTE_LOCUS14960 [Acanthoscelides obtectus]